MDHLLQVLQWDAAVTGIDLANKLKTLMLVAFQDNVQPLAYAATITIGNSITCSGKLIGEGRDALNPKGKMIELKQFGVSLGLLPKGTASMLSESPGGVKTFLLICGLKMWLKEASSIGDVLYQFALLQGVQGQVPISASTLADVVDVLLAYTPRLTEAASEHLKHLDSQIFALCGGLSHLPQRIYHIESSESLAALITSAFQQYTNQEVRYVTLRGSVSAMWIIALLTWLLPDDVCATCKGQVVCGQGSAKITIDLQEHGQETAVWTVETWRASKIEHLIPISFQESQPPQHVPWRITKQFIRAEYDFSDELLSILGQLSGYLVRILVESGQIQGETHLCTNLAEFISPDAVRKYEFINRDFGWDDIRDQDLYDKLQNSLNAWNLLDGTYSWKKLRPSEDFISHFQSWITPCIESSYPMSFLKLDTDPFKLRDLTNLAVITATSALGRLMVKTSRVEQGTEYNPCIYFATYKERIKMVDLLMSKRGIKYQDFRRALYSCILSCLETGESLDTVLVIEQDGLLLYPNIMLGGKVKRTGAFDLIIQPGTIRTGSSQRYKRIRETVRKDNQSTGALVEPISVKAFSESEYIGFEPKTDWMVPPPELLAYTTVQGDSILIRPTLRIFTTDVVDMTRIPQSVAFSPSAHRQAPQRSDLSANSIEVQFRYLDALKTLATALLVTRSSALSVREESDLAGRYRDVLTQTAWLHPASVACCKRFFIIHEIEQRFIVYVAGDPELTLFQLSNVSEQIRTVIMKKGCNLMQAVSEAERDRARSMETEKETKEETKEKEDERVDKRSWVIIMGDF